MQDFEYKRFKTVIVDKNSPITVPNSKEFIKINN